MRLDEVLDGYVLEVEDRFEGDHLDGSLWLPHYLPQWSSREASAARYELADGCLHLLIEEDQKPWCPELDGTTRVSSLQTGVFSGAVGSRVGQHRFHPDAVVREAQEPLRLLTPQHGVFVLRASFPDDSRCMAALWMIGYEDEPERSAEICVCEIFGRNVGRDSAAVGMGLHPFGDPQIDDDFQEIALPIDVREPHEYAAEWTRDRVTFFVDGRRVQTVDQSPGYPMQFMLGIYEFGERPRDEAYPKWLSVERFAAYRPA